MVDPITTAARFLAEHLECSVDDCSEPVRAKTFCIGHYGRWRRHGDPLAGRPTPTGGSCSIADCERPKLARDWCGLHYGRWRRTGDPLAVVPNSAMLPGDQNCKWRGLNVGYTAAHDRVRNAKGAASDYLCEDCGGPAAEWSYDHLDADELIEPTDPKQKRYSAKVEHYQPRCLQCHWRTDHPTGKPTRA